LDSLKQSNAELEEELQALLINNELKKLEYKIYKKVAKMNEETRSEYLAKHFNKEDESSKIICDSIIKFGFDSEILAEIAVNQDNFELLEFAMSKDKEILDLELIQFELENSDFEDLED